MKVFLLSVHVIAAILAIGPVAVAASIFPRYTRQATGDRGGRHLPAALHRITRAYATVGILVPLFGLATALSMGVLGDTWLQVSIALTALAAALLILRVLPGQRGVLAALDGAIDGPDAGSTGAREEVALGARRLAMTTGVFNLLWAVVVVLMIMRPGSSTSVHL